jgi:hypothetical protein
MSRELFRLVGVWSGCWVVRVIINMHGKTTIKKILRNCLFHAFYPAYIYIYILY